MKKIMVSLFLCISLLLGLSAGIDGADRAEVPDTSIRSGESQPDGASSQPEDTQAASSRTEASVPTAGYDKAPATGVEISFDYTRMPTSASNQLAVWVEDAEEKLVKTIFVTSFTSEWRGYRDREMALSHWVSAADPENMDAEEIDGISGATPAAGRLSYVWDLTDESGARVQDGDYFVRVEGTLLWESNILFTAELNTLESEGPLEIKEERSEPDNTDNENMIGDMAISVLREEQRS